MSMPAPYPPITTIEQLLALPDDGLRHELLDGVHVVTPASRYVHQRAISQLEAPEILDETLEWLLPGAAAGKLDVGACFRSVFEEH
jgi:hypothetical protein